MFPLIIHLDVPRRYFQQAGAEVQRRLAVSVSQVAQVVRYCLIL